ncbi:MAG TPA: hypothetical protein VLJ40_10175 [Arthrobacter sp.]|nr:hypothetical protein [Arthrobacter sp.]
MAITSIGYDGSIDETQWAQLVPVVGAAEYGVLETTDWRITASTTTDRGVKVGVGSGWGYGVLDTNTTTITLQGDTVSSGTRWDMVVARRSWGGAGGATSFVLIKGTAAMQLPNRNTDPGTLDDQPLALVQFTAGSTAPTTIIDLRCFARNGGVVAKDELALDYLRHAGAKITIGSTVWSRDLDVNGSPTWNTSNTSTIPLFGARASITGGVSDTKPFLVQAGSYVAKSDANGTGRVNFPNPFPNGLLTVMAFNGDDDSIRAGGMTIASSGDVSTYGASALGTKNDWVYVLHGFASGNNDGPVIRKANTLHRINWIAIGW